MSRVSFYSRFQNPLRILMDNTTKLDQTMRKISSGKEISSPSDDPPSLVRLFRFHNQSEQIDQSKKNIASARNFLDNSEGILSQVTDIFHRMRELGVRAANDSLSSQERDLIAAEVDERLEELVDIANSKMGGRFLFGGAETEDIDEIFSVKRSGNGEITEVTYNGDANQMLNQVGEGENVASNIAGYEVFQASNQKITGGLKVEPDGGYDPLTDPLADSDDVDKTKGYFQLGGEKYHYNTAEDSLDDIGQKINDRGAPIKALIEGNSDITAVDQDNKEFTIDGNFAADFSEGDTFTVKDSTGNDREYTVRSAENDGPETVIQVEEGIQDDTVDGVVSREYNPGDVSGGHDSYQLAFKSRTPKQIYLRDFDRDPDNGGQVEGLLNDLGFVDGKPSATDNFPPSYHQDATVYGKSIFDSLIDFRHALQAGEQSYDTTTNMKYGNAGVDPMRQLDFIEENTGESIQQALEDMQKCIDNNLVHRSIGGARTNRIDSAEVRSEDQKLHITELISQLEDADLAEIITEHKMQEAVQQGSMRMASQVMKLTLANFI